MGTADVNTLSTSCITAGCEVLNRGTKVLLLNGRHFLEVMRQIHLNSNHGKIKQNILASLIVSVYKGSIKRVKRIKLIKHASKMTGIVLLVFKFVDIVGNVLNFAVASEKDRNGKLVAPGL